MNAQDAIDFSREAIKTCMMVGGPILLASLLIGLLVGVFQAMTQIQDQTVSFVPKILLLVAGIGLCLPWLTDQMLDFAKLSFEKPMMQTSIGNDWFRDNTSSSQTNVDLQTPPEPLSYAGVTPRILALPVSFSPKGDSGIPTATADRIDAGANSPFVLPHYRFSRIPKTDIGG